MVVLEVFRNVDVPLDAADDITELTTIPSVDAAGDVDEAGGVGKLVDDDDIFSVLDCIDDEAVNDTESALVSLGVLVCVIVDAEPVVGTIEGTDELDVVSKVVVLVIGDIVEVGVVGLLVEIVEVLSVLVSVNGELVISDVPEVVSVVALLCFIVDVESLVGTVDGNDVLAVVSVVVATVDVVAKIIFQVFMYKMHSLQYKYAKCRAIYSKCIPKLNG